MFVSPTNNVNSKNNDVKIDLASDNINKGKSILEAPPKLEKVVTRNPWTRPNCYKWLATQQNNIMISSRNQNQFPSSLAPLGDLLKASMFLSNLNGFNSSPSSLDQGFVKRKDSSKVWKEKGSK